MKHVFGGFGVAVSLAMVWAAVAAGQTPPTSQPAVKMKPAPAGQVAVTVNGHQIMESEIEKLLATSMPGGELSEARAAAVRYQLRTQARNRLIDNRLLDEEVRKTGIKITDKEMTQQMQEELKGYISINGLTREEFAKRIDADRRLTVKEFLEQRAADPTRRNARMRRKLIMTKFADNVRVSDEEINEHYKSKQERLYTKLAQVRASHILINTKSMTMEEKAAAKKKAEMILAEARNPRADFAALARRYSDCPSKARGGEQSYFPRKGMKPEPFAAAAFALKVGQISDVVETKNGYHIIKVTDRVESKPITLEHARFGIGVLLNDQKIRTERERYVAELRKAAELVYPKGKEPSEALPSPGPVSSQPAPGPK